MFSRILFFNILFTKRLRRNIKNVPLGSYENKLSMKQFISSAQHDYIEHYKEINSIPTSSDISTQYDISALSSNPIVRTVHKYDDHDAMVEYYNREYKNCSSKQMFCLDRIAAALQDNVVLDPSLQLIAFISGAGGTGKSHIIKLAKALVKTVVGKTRGIFGPVVAFAPTGSAAHQVEGFTYQSALNIGRFSTLKVSDKTAAAIGAKVEGVEVIFIEENSLINKESLCKLDVYLKAARLHSKCYNEYESASIVALSKLPFGGYHIIFCGDFYQLAPVGGTPLYFPILPSHKAASIAGHALWQKINFFVELEVNFRFIDADNSLLAKFLAGKSNMQCSTTNCITDT
jgi:hypothetical protein